MKTAISIRSTNSPNQFFLPYRNNKRPDDPIRLFEKYREDQLNFLATDYSEFILYNNIEVTEPPCTFGLTIEELEDIANGKHQIQFFAFASAKKIITYLA